MNNKLLSRKEFVYYLNNGNEAKTIKGNFLCFFEIGIIERFGQWRYAGSANNLYVAIRNIDDFYKTLIDQYNNNSDTSVTLNKDWFIEFAKDEVLEYLDKKLTIKNLLPIDNRSIKELIDDGWNLFDLENRNIGPAEVFVQAEGGAPYDDRGFAIIKVADLTDHTYKNRPAESIVPQSWFGGNWELDWDSSPDNYLKM